MVRLQDVADYAGVSMKTVSNVVHDYQHVSEAMRTRVQKAIDELGYRPNVMGRRLASGRTMMLAVVFSDIALPYFAELARALFLEAETFGYQVLVQQTDGILDKERAIISSSESGLVDGMIIQPSIMDSLEIAQARSDIPIVVLGENAAPLALDHVMIDNVEAAIRITEHLIALGRRRIAFAGHEDKTLTKTSKLRIAGYQSALEAAGLEASPDLLIASSSISAQAGAQAVGDALDSGLKFDALMCRDDLAAIGSLRALHERGIRVPDDVAVTGWDNTPITAVTSPSLTSLAPDLHALAAKAVSFLIDRINGYSGAGRHENAPYSLVLRESAPAA